MLKRHTILTILNSHYSLFGNFFCFIGFQEVLNAFPYLELQFFEYPF